MRENPEGVNYNSKSMMCLHEPFDGATPIIISPLRGWMVLDGVFL